MSTRKCSWSSMQQVLRNLLSTTLQRPFNFTQRYMYHLTGIAKLVRPWIWVEFSQLLFLFSEVQTRGVLMNFGSNGVIYNIDFMLPVIDMLPTGEPLGTLNKLTEQGLARLVDFPMPQNTSFQVVFPPITSCTNCGASAS